MNHKKLKHLATADDRLKAVELRKAGYGYDAIGKALNATAYSAYKAVNTVLEDYKKKYHQSAEQMIAIQDEQLRTLLRAIWPQALQGDHNAIDRALRILERYAKLHGLDAPIEIRIKDREVNEKIESELQKLLAAKDVTPKPELVMSLVAGQSSQSEPEAQDKEPVN